jgi:hypothetical protein
MKFHSFAIAALAAISMNARAQVPCHELEATIDNSLKSAAMASAAAAFDKDITRQTNKLLEANNHLQFINANLTLLIQNKCPVVRRTPLSPAVYFDEAMACKRAEADGRGGAPICDVKTWKGQSK